MWVIVRVKQRGDDAVREFALRFDGAAPDSLRVSPETRDRLAHARAVLVRQEVLRGS